MRHVLVYTDGQGECRVIEPEAVRTDPRTTTEDDVFRCFPEGIVTVLACPKDRIPIDTTYREAWRKGDEKEPIKIDLVKAMDIHRRRIKDSCERKMAQLEVERENAERNSDKLRAVASARTITVLKSLHNLNLTHCKTVQDLKYSVPRELRDVWTFYPLV